MVRVKVCGITNWGDAKLAIDSGANALGFNFYPSSPRCLSPAQAWGIIRKLPPFIEAVGVFVNWPFAAIHALANSVHLNAVQLHGDESPRAVAKCAAAWPVIKVFRVRRGFRPATLAGYREASGFLLDSFDSNARGGTGKQFDWRIAREARRYGNIVLAGGLTPENAVAAICKARPFALDVCSGVESKPGRKDPARLREFMRQVEIADRDLHGLK